MIKYSFILIILLFVITVWAEIPHPVYIQILDSQGNVLDAQYVTFQAWITAFPDDILDENTLDCFYGAYGDYLKINCGQFNNWDPGDELNVTVLYSSTGETGEGSYILNSDNDQTFDIGNGGFYLVQNYPLILNLPAEIIINEDEEVTLNVIDYIYAENPEDLLLSATVMTNIFISIDSLSLTITSQTDWYGEDYSLFTLDDNMGNVVSDSVNFIVQPVNDPPEFVLPISQYNFDEDTQGSLDFSPYITDIDNLINELALTAQNNEFIFIEINGFAVNFTSQENWNGQEIITFTVNDGSGAFASQELEVTVNPINDPPVIELPDDFTYPAGGVCTADLTDLIWDVDGDELELSVSGNQEIIPVFDGLFVTFEVTAGWSGSETMVISADDGQTRAVSSDTITVNIVTLADMNLELPAIEINDGLSFSVDLLVSNIYEEWSVISFSLTIAYDTYILSWEDFSLDTSIITNGTVQVLEEDPGIIEISYAHYLPLSGEGILLTLDFIAVCFGESILDIQNAVFNSESIINITDGSVLVNDIGLEHPPVAIAGPDQVVDELTDTQLDGSASFDPDGDPLSYLWSAPAGIIFSDNTLVNPIISVPDVTEDTEFIISLICNDGTFSSQPDMMIVTVLYVNHAPEITLPDNIDFPEDGALTVDFEQYITDIDPEELTLSATGNENVWIDITGLQVSFSAEADWNGSEIVTFTVDDGLGRLLASDDIEIQVLPVNDAPVADAGESQSVPDGNIVTLDASASYDIEDDELTFLWIPPNGIMLSDPYAINPTFAAPQTIDPVDYTFSLQVSDNQNTDSDEVVITIFDDEPALLDVELLPENEALFTWLAPGTGGSGEELEQGFEGIVIPQGWTNIDNDGDGYGWYILTQSPHSGTKCVASASFWNNNALEPDNWLITPQIEIGGLSYLQFWIAAEDQFHFYEHYSVRLSTTNTNPDSFSEILYTDTLSDNQWQEITMSLMDYAGEAVYIAFVHHDCTDQLLIKLDDVRIYNDDPEYRDTRELTGYNVYLDNVFEAFVEVREYLFTEVYGEHTAGVEAVYDDMNSEMMSIDFNHTPVTEESLIPGTTSLKAIYPNPFNPETTITYDVAHAGNINISIYNLKGQMITELVNGHLEAGHYQIVWKADFQASGIYFIKMNAAGIEQIQKVIMIK
ncbi:MAG: choice-of-anchor J domain-containing protein [Candidatus Cloacimonetes bacterium]|nr:choice-of-anchor J domain-containing protein [Candidatus Cloacimonadota bacterium]